MPKYTNLQNAEPLFYCHRSLCHGSYLRDESERVLSAIEQRIRWNIFAFTPINL